MTAEYRYQAGYIEVWGRGIARILNACKMAGLPEPQIEEYAGGIQVTFFKAAKETAISMEIGKEIGKEKSKEKVLRAISGDATITIRGLAHLLGLSVGGVEKNILLLKSEGLIRRVGPDKGGHWEVRK